MAIIGLQRRIREVGRIRLGIQASKDDGTRYPKKINRFRFTSADRQVIEAAASAYGGKAGEWANGDRAEWEVISEATVIPIILPPNPADLGWSQFYESWGNKICLKRCDGLRDSVRDCPCDCDPDDRECKATSRLSVILPDIPGLGVWRLESHGWNSAVELAAFMEMVEALAGIHSMIPARLRLDLREKRKLENGKPKTLKFVVPVIDLDVSVAQLQAIGTAPGANGTAVGGAPGSQTVGAGSPPSVSGWKPVAALPTPAADVPSIGDQLAEIDAAPAKATTKRSAAPLPGSGRPPRTAAQRAADTEAPATGTPARVSSHATDVCPLCGEGFGGEPVAPNRGRWSRDNKTPRFVHADCARKQAETDEGGDDAAPDTPQGQEPRGGREGTSTEPEVSPGTAQPGPDGEPLPTTAPTEAAPLARNGPKMPTAKMHSQIFALLREVMPVAASIPGRTADEIRREYEMALCAAIGTPGLTSHKQVTYETGSLLIDALKGIKDGTYIFDIPEEGVAPVLLGADGTPVDFTEPFE